MPCHAIGTPVASGATEIDPYNLRISAKPESPGFILKGRPYVRGLIPRRVVGSRREIDESVAHRVVEADAGIECADPESTISVNVEDQRVPSDAEFRINSARITVVSCQPICGADPDETLPVTDHVGSDLVCREPVGSRDAVELEDRKKPLLGKEGVEIHKKEGQYGSSWPECPGREPICVFVTGHDGLTVE